MKLLNIVGRKADNATVLATDVMLARQLKNDGFAHGKNCKGEIARHYDLPGKVRAKCHHALAARRSYLFITVSVRRTGRAATSAFMVHISAKPAA